MSKCTNVSATPMPVKPSFIASFIILKRLIIMFNDILYFLLVQAQI